MLPADPRSRPGSCRWCEVDGEIVSSSHIRALSLAGEVELAARLLGDPFQLRGEVVERRPARPGARIPDREPRPGRGLVCPGHGVYAARADGDCAAVSVGVRPTFGTGRAVLVEAYLIDSSGDLLRPELRVDFLTRLRGERRFETVEALVEQMHVTWRAARAVLEKLCYPRPA